jgi:hypothetical protein
VGFGSLTEREAASVRSLIFSGARSLGAELTFAKQGRCARL